MQDLSYDTHDPEFEFGGYRFSVQVFTFENVYGLSPDRCRISEDEASLAIECAELRWAGGQERAPGVVRVRASRVGERVRFELEAGAERVIRCVKLTLKNVPGSAVVNLREARRLSIPKGGLTLRYPDGWRGLYTPLVVLADAEGRCWYARSLDRKVREKRFALLPKRGPSAPDSLDLELIFEELASDMGTTVRAPDWEVGPTSSAEAILREHADFLERAYALQPWEARPDVPSWARRTALVAAVHGQHWSGYVFNDYERTLGVVDWLATEAERLGLEPDRILVFLAGWEGRYYWQYGDFRPDPRMGGEAGFARLCDHARARGVRLMPMFGMNVANRGLPNFEQWGQPAITSSAGQGIRGGSPDWDGSRNHDHGWVAWLNPASPSWQNHLVAQILRLADRYGFEGVYLDISAAFFNDPNGDTHSGLQAMVRRLHAAREDLLIGGEGWYDAAGLATPLVMSGAFDGVMHWHDEPFEPIFSRYNRSFAHLSIGDPSRGSTGVHELGFNEGWRSPLRAGVIPTLAVVEDTLERAPQRVREVLEDARRYASEYCAATAREERATP